MKLKLSDINAALPTRIGIFLSAASFEKRCLSIPEAIPADSVDVVLMSTSTTIGRYSRPNEKRILRHFGEKAIRTPHAGTGPLSFADALRKALSQLDKSTVPNVVVDVTTFTRETLLIMLKMLREWTVPSTPIYIAYNGAEHYETGKRQWLSADYRDVRSVLGYPGELKPTQNLHLIVLFGFEVARAVRAIRAFDPSILSIGHGDEAHSITPEHYRRNMELFDRIATIRPGVNQFTLSLDDPFRASSEVSELSRGYPTYNTVIVPMNTKLSTIGAGFCAWADPRIQLSYVAAHRYNVSGYSSPSEFAHVFELPPPVAGTLEQYGNLL